MFVVESRSIRIHCVVYTRDQIPDTYTKMLADELKSNVRLLERLTILKDSSPAPVVPGSPQALFLQGDMATMQASSQVT